MFDLASYLHGLAAVLIVATMTWLVSVIRRDVSIVDSLWSLMFLLAAVVYAADVDGLGERAILVLVLTGLWALRLAAYITWRNWGAGEDARYQAIRANNAPHFAIKSLFIVFWLQAVLAWVISLPLLAGIHSDAPLGLFDLAAAGLWLLGFVYEAVGDWQLARFKSDPGNRGKVCDVGLWRNTRHPNYFGNACIWWGLFGIALAGGGWWSIVAPVLMTVLLLKVSGVALLEKDISERRPGYRDYVAATNAFIPGPRKR